MCETDKKGLTELSEINLVRSFLTCTLFSGSTEKGVHIRISGLALVTAIGATGLAGGAAITTALAALGPGGILGGIATLGIIGLISEGIVQYGMDAMFSVIVKELYRKGEIKEEILQKVKRYPISKDLKRKLKENIEKI